MGLVYVLKMRKLWTFQELATKAYDMEVMIANHCGISFSFAELKKDKVEFKRNIKLFKNSTKEVMSISKTKPNWKVKGVRLLRMHQGGVPY